MKQPARRRRWVVRTLLVAIALATGARGGERVPVVKPVVLAVVPHDPQAFTQGLYLHAGVLYESTGLYGRSSLRRVDPATGRVLTNVPVATVFAEGITVRGGVCFMLSWQEEVLLRFDVATLAPFSGVVRYRGEGWGLTHDTVGFIMSNGSDTLYRRDSLFAITGARAVTAAGAPLPRLNELEYARGRVFANIWYCDSIAEIDLTSGRVLRFVDCSDLRRQAVRAAGGRADAVDVLNGIACNANATTFYLTGKLWPVMFAVAIPR